MLGLAFVLWLFPALAAAQNFTVPSSWLNTTSHFTRSERIALAQGAIDQIITHSFPPGAMAKALPNANQSTYFLLLPIISAIARKDFVSGTQDNKAYVDGELGALIRNDTSVLPEFENGSDIPYLGSYAMACMEAYHAYGGEQYVQKASGLWTAMQANQVTEMNAASGSHDGINFQPECMGQSVVGAVPTFWIQEQGGVVINLQDMTDFIRLSAYMVETGATNTTVTDSAYAALQFWRTVLLSLSPVPGCSLGSLLLNPLNSTECTSGSPYLDCSSYYAEGALALSAATQNSSWYRTITDELGTFLLSSTIPSNGVITETAPTTFAPGSDGGEYYISNKFGMMFSLAEIWNLSVSQAPELANLLQAFTNVQLNAMMANATNVGSNLYSTEWSGPPATNYSLSGMSGALSALIAAIGPTPSQNQTTPAPSSSGSAAPSSSGSAAPSNHNQGHHSVPHDAVIGIAIAGAAIVCLMMA